MPATEWIRVTSSASLCVSGARIDGQAACEHRLPGAGRAGEQEVVRTRGRELERAAAPFLPAHVGEIDCGRDRIPERRSGSTGSISSSPRR